MEQLIHMTSAEDDELIKDLFFMNPNSIPSADSQLLSPVYSGPTVQEIETALSYNNYDDFHQQPYNFEAQRISMLERSYLNKVNNDINKYTLRIKNCGNVMADDGYKWRKYGQKSIKNSPNPRSYYRCTNSRCSAKKQVEKSSEDPDTLIITYEGLHLHYTYPFNYLLDQQQQHPPIKKQKGPAVDITENGPGPVTSPIEITQQAGLLEDVVPLMIRKPLIPSLKHSNSNSHSASSSSSSPSSPISSNSFSWSLPLSYLGLI